LFVQGKYTENDRANWKKTLMEDAHNCNAESVHAMASLAYIVDQKLLAFKYCAAASDHDWPGILNKEIAKLNKLEISISLHDKFQINERIRRP